MAEPAALAAGLTTTKAAFIEEARAQGQLYIHQPYELYSDENHHAWQRLYERMIPRWERYANQHFLEGLDLLRLDPTRVARLDDVNRFLKPLTGFQARAVSGYVPVTHFFDCLGNREFPTTITIRGSDRLDYLPEPDIFHDIAGHVPMHTDRQFAETLVRFGGCAHIAVELLSGVRDQAQREGALTGILRAMARFFWFTIEFGLMRGRDGLKVYGSGLLSSFGEIEHAIDSPEVQRYPLQLEWIINQVFEVNHFQPLLFFIDSFDHLFGLVDTLEKWMRAGKLNNVAPGKPDIEAADLNSFLTAMG